MYGDRSRVFHDAIVVHRNDDTLSRIVRTKHEDISACTKLGADY